MSSLNITTDHTNSSSQNWSKIAILKYVKTFTYCTFFTIAVVLLFAQTFQAIKVYLDEPTYTETLLYKQENTTFPVVTICPLENAYNSEILQVSEFYDIVIFIVFQSFLNLEYYYEFCYYYVTFSLQHRSME